MLYGVGHKDIMSFTTGKEIISEGPGYQFNYTTGTPAITMGALKNVYGSEYDEMPWKSLFNPLGMKNITFERDEQGVFNGGSAVFATPRDMAKIGYLYLNKGMWNGKEILSADWIKKTLEVSPGYLSEGTVIKSINFQGVFGGSMWLNRKVKTGFGKPFPTLPEDMFFARGRYGQLIIMLPTQKMIIVRTGHDFEYNSKLDEFVSRAISCFDDPKYPIGKYIPQPKSTVITLPRMMKTLTSGLQSNLIPSAVAKTICSCHFITGLDLDTCMARSNIPAAKILTAVTIKDNSVYSEQSKLSKIFVKGLGVMTPKIAQASFDINHPEFGCTLK